MNASPFLFVCVFGLSLTKGVANESDAKSPSSAVPEKAKAVLERLRFVPEGGPWKGEAGFNGAAWHNLRPGLTKGVLDMTARAGIGDTFPVAEKDAETLFKVKLVAGNDEEITVEVLARKTQKLLLKRDKTEEVEVEGLKYRLRYPSTSVEAAPGEKPSTNKARIFVSRKV
jgi:hypothetical protein